MGVLGEFTQKTVSAHAVPRATLMYTLLVQPRPQLAYMCVNTDNGRRGCTPGVGVQGVINVKPISESYCLFANILRMLPPLNTKVLSHSKSVLYLKYSTTCPDVNVIISSY